jgi:hypothetical protein
MTRFQTQVPTGSLVQELELLVRTAIFKPANALVGHLLQAAADRIDAAYQPRPGQVYKGREACQVQGLFGCFPLERDYYYHAGKQQGHYPADAALGLEVGYTPALARILCLEGADEASYQKAELHLAETGGIAVSARQIQRVVQRVGQDAQAWQEREVQPEQCAACDAPVFYVSADGTGAPMRPEELEGRQGKQADGKAKTRQVYLGCVFTQHRVDEKGHPVRDWDSTTYVSSLDPIDPEYKPRLRCWAKRLLKNGVEKLIDQSRQEAVLVGRSAAVEEKVGYFVGNVARMQYGTFREQGLFIGSGVIEAGCKTVIGSRCKQSGMFWGGPRGSEHSGPPVYLRQSSLG